MNRSLQSFVQDVYGNDVWFDIATMAGLPSVDFEAMLSYEDGITWDVIGAACLRLRKSQSEFLEDLGLYLVSHPKMWRIRRLLRFGGAGFEEFLESLDDLEERARLAIPDLEMPRLKLGSGEGGKYLVTCEKGIDGIEHVLLGSLRAIADDYGALAVVDLVDPPDVTPDYTCIEVTLLSASFAEGRSFVLAAGS